jgi:hypothetical protein
MNSPRLSREEELCESTHVVGRKIGTLVDWPGALRGGKGDSSDSTLVAMTHFVHGRLAAEAGDVAQAMRGDG